MKAEYPNFEQINLKTAIRNIAHLIVYLAFKRVTAPGTTLNM